MHFAVRQALLGLDIKLNEGVIHALFAFFFIFALPTSRSTELAKWGINSAFFKQKGIVHCAINFQALTLNLIVVEPSNTFQTL